MKHKVSQMIDIYKEIVYNLNLEPQNEINMQIIIRFILLDNSLQMRKIIALFFKFFFHPQKMKQRILKMKQFHQEKKYKRLLSFQYKYKYYSQSNQVLNCNLAHIRGSQIVKGDLQHLSNFLQILHELSKLFKDRALNSVKILHPLSKIHKNQLRCLEYFYNSQDEKQTYQEEDNDHLQKSSIQSNQFQINKNAKQRNNQSCEQQSKKKDDRKSSQLKNQQGSNQQRQKRPIRSHSLKKPTDQDPKFQKKLPYEPRSQPKKQQSFTKQKEKYSENTKSSQDSQYSLDFETQNKDEVDYEFLQQFDEKDIKQLDDNDPIKIKYVLEKQKEEILKVLQEKILHEENHQNFPASDEQIDIQMKNIKESFKKMKPKPSTENMENINEQKNQYRNFLKDQLKNFQQIKQIQNVQKQDVNSRTSTKIKQNDLIKDQFENVHLFMQHKLRDEKLNYLKKIHRIVFELEKRQIIDEKYDHRQARRQQNILTRNILDSVESSYDDQIVFLKQKIQKQRNDRLYEGISEKSILSKLEKELKEEKIKDRQNQKEVWKYEKEKFEQLMKDDGELEKKILQIYKRY
ncbi:unnamed protein product (macronuclear) [Paramecium tetraurelia]|uniref:DUF5745 domain-containing protein n=1 Tax=Paramecium tetraurelia TaxID=5888 RepID=A0DPR0_PARTE|nr:uncharacterized protein GSPATT00019209001 [Paramecium tetraurelia]CAK85027.1 unnamed protein product [Paramecium tetraurelia]|eukprot:XP_001452424.1 hypothetical protein (macronuclear) [Paramecium tetraurelia strain d4-2]